MSKSFQSFEGKVRSLKLHIQLADVAFYNANKICNSQKSNGLTIAETLGSTLIKHPQLNHPNNASDIGRVFATSRIKLNEQALIELYAYFADYISSVIRELENRHSSRILAIVPPQASTNLSYKDVFLLGSYNAILDEIAKRVYRNLEDERSTPKLLNKFIKTTKLNIPANIKEDALVYLEIRHLIIHNNSRADAKFHIINNKNLVLVNQRDKKVSINYAVTNAAIDAVKLLCKTIDGELLRVGLIK